MLACGRKEPPPSHYPFNRSWDIAPEHVWMTSSAPDNNARAYAQLSHGRFCGERVPGSESAPASTWDWLAWWGRTICVHIPTRVAVLVGDLPAHDWHHLAAVLGHSPRNWPTAIYERQRAIDAGDCAGMDKRELWGLGAMIRHVLLSMSLAPAFTASDSMRQEVDCPAKSK